VLVCLILALARRKFGYVELAILVHLINMIAPQAFRPVAVVWFGLSQIMGNVVSRVVMVIVFFVVVTPIAFWRRLQGADALRLKIFKAGHGTVMQQRNHTFSRKDLEKPY
jgi:ABC-type nitrate/sulfonate/bicarbonate transport system permease component